MTDNSYSCEPGTVTALQRVYQWEPLSDRRRKARLTLMFKIVNDCVDIPADDYFTRSTSRIRHTNSMPYVVKSPNTDIYKHSFVPKTGIGCLIMWSLQTHQLIIK